VQKEKIVGAEKKYDYIKTAEYDRYKTHNDRKTEERRMKIWIVQEM